MVHFQLSSSSSKFFEKYCAWQNIIILVLMIIFDALIIKKLGFKIERWIIITIFSYTASAFSRAFESILFLASNKSFFDEFMT